MSDFSVRSDNVDVEQIMRQIRARIREKRGVDYTEEEIRELASVKLEKFLDPKGVRSDLLQQYRGLRASEPAPPNFRFEDTTLYETHRGLLRFVRRLLNPLLKLFFNPTPLVDALHIQSQLNTRNAQREALDTLHYELMHNLVVELTRTSVELKNLKMRLESISSRLDFDERRARALEGVVQYRAGSVAPMQPPAAGGTQAAPAVQNDLDADGNERRARRRRRRGRRRSERPGEPRQGGGERAGHDARASERDVPAETSGAPDRRAGTPDSGPAPERTADREPSDTPSES